MPDVKLGPVGSIINLPVVQWTGSEPGFPVSTMKQIKEKRMSDGSLRFGFYQTKREWQFDWGTLTLTELDALRDMYALNQILRFQNNWEDDTWYDVVFYNLTHYPAIPSARGFERYECIIILREA